MATRARVYPIGTTFPPGHPEHSAWQVERLSFKVQLRREDFIFPPVADEHEARLLESGWKSGCSFPDDMEAKAVRYLSQQWNIRRKPNNLRARRVAEARGHHTPAQVRARVAFYGGLCWICRERPHDGLDHVKPLARGGSHWPANLRPACRSCNSRKRDTWPFALAFAGRGGV